MIFYEKAPPLVFECSFYSAKENQLVVPRFILKTFGFQENAICETFENQGWSLKVFSEDKKKVDLLKQNLIHINLPGIKVGIRSLKPAQWLTRWKNHWKPLSLTKTIDVIPAWYKERFKSKKKIIYLDTLMSFGTGMHETTQLMAQLIEDNSSHLSSFLDIGTGTGILALVALQLGSKKVVAMDVSPLSIQAARSNFKVNGLSAKLVLSDVSKLSSKQKYQTVAANLVTEDLLKFKRKIVSLVKPTGMLMISGISKENLKRIQEGFKDLPLTCCKIKRGKQWVALSYVKKM